MTPPTHDHAPARQPGSASASSRALRAVHSVVSKLAPGKGIYRDVVARAPWYASDWRDAWNYRVVPATALIFFANVLPGIAFSLDLIETTNQYGVSEVLLSSFMAAFIFAVFGAQPLCIAGVTGPITVLNKTIYDIMIKDRPDAPDYLQFVGWVYMWGAILHWITAILNACNFLRYVTLFSCDTFGFYVSWVYLEYGIQVITRQLSTTPPAGVLTTLVLALIMLGTCLAFRVLSASTLFHRHIRRVFADYGMPASLVAASACAYWGLLNRSNPPTLPISRAFEPANGRGWLVRFWELDAANVGIAFPFGLVLWILFFFDHNVSSLMAQAAHFPLRKPPGFHWDFFLLGCTTFIAGLLGVPAPNGLIPQAPIHTDSLVVRGVPARCRDAEAEGRVDKGVSGSTTAGSVTPGQPDLDEKREVDAEDAAGRWKEVPVGVVEQRVSNLAQGSLCLILLTGPFLHVLNLIPKGVLAGLFWYMALDALAANGITHKLRFLVADRTLLDPRDPLRRVRRSRIVLFVAVQLVGFGATFAVTQTIAAIGFPVIILFLLPLRTLVVPRLPFTADELAILDGPTASPFTMESVGGGAY